METDVNKVVLRKDIWIIKGLIKQLDGFWELFLLFKEGDVDKPLLLNNKICIFGMDELIAVLHDIGFPISPAELEDEVALVYDLDKVIDLILNRSVDKKATLINFINMHLDLITAVKVNFPEDYKKIIYSFADHLTFNKRYDHFLKKNQIDRRTLADIIYWINGVVFSNALFFDKCMVNQTFPQSGATAFIKNE